MKKAFLIEFTVFTGYIKQLLPIAAITGFFLAIGMGNTVAIAGIFACMFCMTGSMAASAYDDAGNWGAYRLTLPLSRRDVVLGRYAVVCAMGAVGVAMGLLLQLLAAAVGALDILPAQVDGVISMSLDDVLASLFTVSICLFMGLSAASIAVPIYFKLGNTTAAQLLPMGMMLLYAVAVVLIGQVAEHVDLGSAVSRVLTWIETPAGVAAVAALMVALSALVLFISATVSLRIYARRDL